MSAQTASAGSGPSRTGRGAGAGGESDSASACRAIAVRAGRAVGGRASGLEGGLAVACVRARMRPRALPDGPEVGPGSERAGVRAGACGRASCVCVRAVVPGALTASHRPGPSACPAREPPTRAESAPRRALIACAGCTPSNRSAGASSGRTRIPSRRPRAASPASAAGPGGIAPAPRPGGPRVADAPSDGPRAAGNAGAASRAWHAVAVRRASAVRAARGRRRARPAPSVLLTQADAEGFVAQRGRHEFVVRGRPSACGRSRRLRGAGPRPTRSGGQTGRTFLPSPFVRGRPTVPDRRRPDAHAHASPQRPAAMARAPETRAAAQTNKQARRTTRKGRTAANTRTGERADGW